MSFCHFETKVALTWLIACFMPYAKYETHLDYLTANITQKYFRGKNDKKFVRLGIRSTWDTWQTIYSKPQKNKMSVTTKFMNNKLWFCITEDSLT